MQFLETPEEWSPSRISFVSLPLKCLYQWPTFSSFSQIHLSWWYLSGYQRPHLHGSWKHSQWGSRQSCSISKQMASSTECTENIVLCFSPPRCIGFARHKCATQWSAGQTWTQSSLSGSYLGSDSVLPCTLKTVSYTYLTLPTILRV